MCVGLGELTKDWGIMYNKALHIAYVLLVTGAINVIRFWRFVGVMSDF